MQRRVSHTPRNQDFVYLPKDWNTRYKSMGWDGNDVEVTANSRLIVEPLPKASTQPFIVVKTPLRLPLGGGGSDLPEYYSKYGGGLWVSGAISSYIYVVLKNRFETQGKFVYSETQYADNPSQFNHPILRAVLSKYNLCQHLEFASFADLPSNLGLGSSGAFTVGLIKAVQTYLKIDASPVEVAEEAYEIERSILGRKIGKQDQYVAALGGLNVYGCDVKGKVAYTGLDVGDLAKWLLLFYVDRRQVSAEQAIANISEEDRKIIVNLGAPSAEALRKQNYPTFGEYVDKHWQIKKKTQPPHFDALIMAAKAKGAIGGKLCGAGLSGCILLVCPPECRLAVAEEMKKADAIQVNFNFEPFGSERY